ncbi:MAG: alpha/beta hydrolase fold domain-containing protein [Novosphingobium sp.]|nr:alpha/beta hydrolase fold domain-containing protein [Novosphingobium sp.]MCP5403963.1 alpha/beta hydrolase fold domain-containing protein [Novosphingobium sp.]
MTELDPEIRAFTELLSAGWREHPPLSELSLPEARAVAEKVRERWRAGGPEMERTEEADFPTPAGPMRVRRYVPADASDTASIVYLHGGGFTFFSIDTHDRIMREYASAAGIEVFGLDYALSPEHKFPVALEQALAFVRDLADRNAGAGLILAGDSAGANLALSAAARLRDEGKNGLISGLVLNYGAFGPGNSDEAERRFGGPDAILNRAEMEYFWNNYLQGEEDYRNPAANLLEADLSGLPPVLLVVPECDILTEQSHAIAGKLGPQAELRVYPGATHSFLEAMSVSSLARRAIAETALWVRERLPE